MTHADLARWIVAYERAWRTAGTQALGDLFTATATYRAAPFDEPRIGLEAIAEFWDDEREGPHETFALDAEIVAVDGRVGVARVEVRYGSPPSRSYRDLWIVTLDSAGRCTAFEEWPFFPGQPREDVEPRPCPPHLGHAHHRGSALVHGDSAAAKT